MLNSIKAFTYTNPTIQNLTGYSFSFSNLLKNVNRIALPTIALTAGMYVTVRAEDLSEDRCYCSYDECIILCSKGILPYEDFFHELGKCTRVSATYFP